MSTQRNEHFPDETDECLKTQALVVTHGPFEGRICENDDDEFLFKADFSIQELAWIEKAGIKWRVLEAEDFDDDPTVSSDADPNIGVDCEVVTFGFYLDCRGHYYIPRQFLRPATTRDLIQRHQEIGRIVFEDAWRERRRKSRSEIIGLLKEENYIVNELWRREKIMPDVKEPRNVFLCHSSADKPFVRQVYSDLANMGHKPWLDEYEIKVGDSLVQKIDEGTKGAGALVLFLSRASVGSMWVRREWSSTLARQLSSKNIRILPALLEDCETPSILADIKYADFRESYHGGLGNLVIGLA